MNLEYRLFLIIGPGGVFAHFNLIHDKMAGLYVDYRIAIISMYFMFVYEIRGDCFDCKRMYTQTKRERETDRENTFITLIRQMKAMLMMRHKWRKASREDAKEEEMEVEREITIMIAMTMMITTIKINSFPLALSN